MSDSSRRRGNKRERTRQALIAAALEVVGEHGFTGASLEAIARRAGVTRGSIYSNFADRDELLMAAVASRGMKLDRDLSGEGPLRVRLRRFAEDLFDQLPTATGGGGLVIEYQLYAMGQPRLRERLSATYAEMFEKMAASLASQGEDKLPISMHALALAVQALAMGLVWQYMLAPADVRREDVIAAFQVLAAGAERSF